MDAERLETPKQLAGRVGITERKVRHLIATQQLEHIMIGCRVHIPVGAFARFLEASKVKASWHGETKDQNSDGLKSVAAIISSGPNEAAAASAALARQTANRLKSRSPSSCSSGIGEPARVIRLPSS
jgi:hypothetical protein